VLLFSNFVKMKLADAWWLGTKNRTMAMVMTPSTCHHALTSDRNATICTPKVLSTPWTKRMAA
jgi:hypothetical protein